MFEISPRVLVLNRVKCRSAVLVYRGACVIRLNRVYYINSRASREEHGAVPRIRR
jgi:hypothetical protein